MNLCFFCAFSFTLYKPPSMIYRFAVLMDKSIPGSPWEKKISIYCRKVTLVWITFFVVNGCVAAWTIITGSDAQWAIYNGGISYILMGILFAGEYITRRMVQKKMPKFIPLSEMNKNSRELSTALCYKGTWDDKDYRTWEDFLKGSAVLRRHIEATGGDKWLLHSEDCWFFLLAFIALLQCKKEVMLTANISPAYLVEIKGDAPFLTDREFPGLNLEKTFHIPSLLNEKSEAGENADFPVINSDDAYFYFYTSGTTGKPKMIQQHLKEYESDNRNMLREWGEKLFYPRKVCSTVSQHHIYGFVFSLLLPFTAGIPFRRNVIVVPEELENFTDVEYFIVTVPAYLKRAVELETPLTLKLKNPCILASGGFLFPDVAQRVFEVFGVWPWEMYGSTETSGIAWRYQNEGPMWTPFPNIELSVNEDSCLVVRSDHVKTKTGIFETADLVKMLPNGKFILMGRMDSIVKIEEKRISLPEVENRINESGLAADAAVIPMEDNRQYLVAAIVFNAEGKAKFKDMEKNQINKFWREHLAKYFEAVVIPKKYRYVDSIPTDMQGKKKREDIEMLFADDNFAE